LNAGDSLATWPLANRLEAFLSQRVIRDCGSIELDPVAVRASLPTAANLDYCNPRLTREVERQA